MNNNFKIMEINEDTIEEALKVIHKSFETVAKEYGLTKENSRGNAAFLSKDKLINDKKSGNLMYGFFKDEELIGFMQLKSKDKINYTLENLSVIPTFRHFGYGKLLVNYAKEMVEKHGGSKISLGCIYENKKLCNWYEENGFAFKGKKQFKKYPYIVGFFEYKY